MALYMYDSLTLKLQIQSASKNRIYSLAYDDRTGYVIYTDANGS